MYAGSDELRCMGSLLCRGMLLRRDSIRRRCPPDRVSSSKVDYSGLRVIGV